MSDFFLGEVRLFSFAFAPEYWAKCDGTLLPINQNQALFSLLGANYGGDGRITFGLPDLRGVVPVGFATNSATLGGLTALRLGSVNAGGAETVTLSSAQIPAHNHTFNGRSDAPTTSVSPANALPSTIADINVPINDHPAYANPTGKTLQPISNKSIGLAGAGAPHNNMQPFLVGNYCIATSGMYPPRSY